MGLLEILIDHHLVQKQLDSTRPMRNKLHPSTIGMCQRRIALDMLMVPTPLDQPRAQRIFDNGHALHARYEHLFAEMGILVQAEMKIEREHISGHTDAWIKIKNFAYPDGEDYLVELKSASNKSFQRMVEGNLPKEEHYAQLMFYLHLTGIQKGIILVENKDTQELWEYAVQYDAAYANALEQKAKQIIALVQERRLPPIPEKGYAPTSYACTYCPFQFYCHNQSYKNNGEQRYPIPFAQQNEMYHIAAQIIEAINALQPLPDLMAGSTKGDLARQVYVGRE